MFIKRSTGCLGYLECDHFNTLPHHPITVANLFISSLCLSIRQLAQLGTPAILLVRCNQTIQISLIDFLYEFAEKETVNVVPVGKETK